jgi:hypothetical protein
VKKAPSRSSRGRSAKPAARRTKAKAPRQKVAKKAAAKKASKSSTTVACQAPGCDNKFVPYGPLASRQRFCSSTCRQRAFYWEFKKKHRGKRYAQVRGYR